jgi:acyl-coenzyme A synthetase/AMP-(fatty) acid ligase
MDYKDFFEQSIENPDGFWAEQAKQIAWYKPPTQILAKDGFGHSRWFADGKLNVSYLCADKHVADGFGDQTAIIYDSPVTKKIERISFYKLKDEISRLAGGLQLLGIGKGDTVLIYMPMIPQAVYAMLACARIGAIHSVVFGGFAPHELAIRINDAEPKVIITASNGIEVDKIIHYKPFVDQAIEEAMHKPQFVINFERGHGADKQERPYDVDYNDLIEKAHDVEPLPVLSYHPLYILYTSGTTGTPKGIIRDSGGYATALKFSMKYIYNVEPGETYWAASDVGWVVGHSYIVYGPLINRNTTVLFEGKPIKTPDASTFWRVIAEHKVKVMFTAPTAIRAIKKEDPDGVLMKKYDLSCLKYQFLAGERCDITTLEWLQNNLKVPVIDHFWQTESGWPMLANMTGIELMPVKPGSASLPVCGYDIQILDVDGNPLPANTEGFVAVKLPLPPGTLTNLWRNNHRFVAGYLERFPGFYFTGDGGYIDSDGYVFITGRVDDIINVAGHRLSTAAMEEVVASHYAVAECAVFGIECELKGQRPLGIVVLKMGTEIEIRRLESEIVSSIRYSIGSVASFREIVVVPRLPKTRSGKVLRSLMRAMVDKKAYTIPSTIEDTGVIAELESIFNERDFSKMCK